MESSYIYGTPKELPIKENYPINPNNKKNRSKRTLKNPFLITSRISFIEKAFYKF